MFKTYFLYYILLLTAFASITNAQSFDLFIYEGNNFNKKESHQFKNQSEASTYLRNKVAELQEKGFLSASIDSVSIIDTAMLAWKYKGPKIVF